MDAGRQLGAWHWTTGQNTSLWSRLSPSLLARPQDSETKMHFHGPALKSRSIKLLPHYSQSGHKGKGTQQSQGAKVRMDEGWVE